MKIYFNDTFLEIDFTDASYRYRAVMGDDSLTLYFSLPEYLDIPVGAYIDFEGARYELLSPQNFKKAHSRDYEYTLILEGAPARLKKYMMRDTTSQSDDLLTGRLKFSYTARPAEHIEMIVANLNKREAGWTVGEVIDAPEKVVTYSHNSVLDALGMIAEAYDTEWDIQGHTINLRKAEYNKEAPLVLSYGMGNGFKSGVARTNDTQNKAIEVLFIQGGERNIDSSKYGSDVLLLPKGQSIAYDGIRFEDEDGFDDEKARTYISDAEGYSIYRSDKALQTKEEGSLDLSEIYPSREGTVSEVIVVDAEKNFYDFTDTSIPEELDYSKYRIAGETATIIFQTGMLAGKEFDIEQSNTSLSGYDHAKRRFALVPQEIDGQTMPNDVFKPAEGDKYTVFHIALPQEYIREDNTKSGASWDMMRQAVKYLYEHESPTFSFTGELDGIWAKKDWPNIGGKIVLGGYVLFSDAQFLPEGELIRIVGVKDYINNPHSPEIELSNTTTRIGLSSQLGKIDSNEEKTEELHQEALRFTRRRFREAQETAEMLANGLLHFEGSIQPITVQTMQLIAGDENLQFRFVDGKTNPAPKAHNVIFNAEGKTLSAEAGILQHLTLGIDKISPVHEDSEYRFWDIPEFKTPPLTETNKGYYLYAKVDKEGTTGVFYLSETAIAMEQVDGYYHLLVGILNSEYDGTRSFSSMYGFSEVLPGRITTRSIVSTDGSTYFDLDAGEIGGRIVFSDKSTTDSGQTIIEGGKLNSDIINTDTLVAKRIQSAEGKIANFIIQENQLVGVGEKIIFSNELLPALEELINGSQSETTTYQPGANASYISEDTTTIDNGGLSLDYTAKINDMSIPYAGVLSFKALNKVVVSNLQQGGMLTLDSHTATVNLYKIESDGTLTKKGQQNMPATTSDTSQVYSFYIPEPGNYRLEATAAHRMQSMWAEPPAETPSWVFPTYTLSSDLEILGITTDGQIRFSGSQEATQIGTDGFYSFWSLLNYLYFSQSQGLKVKGNCIISSPNGENTLTIDDNGISLSVPAGADASEYTAVFTQASTRANIESGEKLKALFGKIKKWFADMKTVAFTGAYSDLNGNPTSLPADGGHADTAARATADADGKDIRTTYLPRRDKQTLDTDVNTLWAVGSSVVLSHVNTPTTDTYYLVSTFGTSGSDSSQIAIPRTGGPAYYRGFNANTNTWTSWERIRRMSDLVTTAQIAARAITEALLSSDLTLPGTPQVGTPSGLNGASQNVATIGNVNEALTNIQIGGTNIYQDATGTSDFYLTTDGQMKYRRFLDLIPEAKRNLRGRSLAVSFDYVLENAIISRNHIGFQFFVRYADGTQTQIQAMLPAEATAVTKSGRFFVTTKIDDKEIANITSFQPYLYVQTTSGTATVGRPKFEIGTKATQWSPSPEEAQSGLNEAIQTVQDLADQLETDVNNTLGSYMTDIVQPAIDSSIEDAISSISHPAPATTNGAGTVRLATQEEVDTGEVTENIPEGSNPDEPPAVVVTPMDLQRKLGGYATTTALGSKADKTQLPKVYYQATAPTGFKDGDIWIKP